MSDERRKRQLERDGGSSASNRKLLTYAAILVVAVGVYYAGWRYKNHKYDAFAQCLATKQAKMYGLYWCPHCLEQKEMLGASFHYVPYVECGLKGEGGETEECKIAGIKLFPSWQFGSETPKEGVLSLEALSDKTGCALP